MKEKENIKTDNENNSQENKQIDISDGKEFYTAQQTHKLLSQDSKYKSKRVGRHSSESLQDKENTDKGQPPSTNNCLGVFGLNSYTDEKYLKSIFAEYGEVDDIVIIYDRDSHRSKGYGFVYYKYTADAIEARKATQGLIIDGRQIRVDFSFTTRPHPPTPGRYLGERLQKNGHYNNCGRFKKNYRYNGCIRYNNIRSHMRNRRHYKTYDKYYDDRDNYDTTMKDSNPTYLATWPISLTIK